MKKLYIVVLAILLLDNNKAFGQVCPYMVAGNPATCSGVLFFYVPPIANPYDSIGWHRPQVTGITPDTGISAGATIYEVLVNHTSQPITVKYFFRIIKNDCVPRERVDTLTVTVNPTPVINPLDDHTFCNRQLVPADSIKFTSSTPNSFFSWQLDADIGIGLSGNGSIAPFVPVNNGNSRVTSTVYVSVNANGCAGEDVLFFMNINPSSFLTTAKTAATCSGSIFSYTAETNYDAGTLFSWVRDSVDGISNARGTGSSELINETLNNTTTLPVNVTYVFTAVSSADCNITDRLTVTVNPSPLLTSYKSTTICNNSAFTYTAESSYDPVDIYWHRTAVAGINNPAHADTLSPVINESLQNISVQNTTATYYLTLMANGCTTHDSILVNVNATPVTDSIAGYKVCNGDLISGINFSSNFSGATYKWVCDQNIGIGALNGTGNIPAFNASNSTGATIDATVTVSIYQLAGADTCRGPDRTFTITIYPTPALLSAKTASVCNGTSFNYDAISSAANTGISWYRLADSFNVANGGNNDIDEILHNEGSQPIIVKYVFTLSANLTCSKSDSILVRINPTPVINPVSDVTYCNRDSVTGFKFSSASPDSTFTWTCSPTIGFGTDGGGYISSFEAINRGNSPITATVTVHITASADNCPGAALQFLIKVNPSPPKPGFTWLNLGRDNVCSGAGNINFNIQSPPSNGVAYLWKASETTITIKDTVNPNTVISFPAQGTYSVKAIATDTISGGCTDSVLQTITVLGIAGITEEKIILKQPGNLLVYPDNSMNPVSGYQWGYDSVLRSQSSFTLSAPREVDGQVYQFFIPTSARFFTGNELDTARYKFWVLLRNDRCYTKVYYNGPYAGRPAPVSPPENNTVQLRVVPNSNNGTFDIVLKGNIYGTVKARIYNAMGQVVFTNQFAKVLPEVKERVNKNNLPNGVYYILVNSHDLKKAVGRFIVQH